MAELNTGFRENRRHHPVPQASGKTPPPRVPDLGIYSSVEEAPRFTEGPRATSRLVLASLGSICPTSGPWDPCPVFLPTCHPPAPKLVVRCSVESVLTSPSGHAFLLPLPKKKKKKCSPVSVFIPYLPDTLSLISSTSWPSALFFCKEVGTYQDLRSQSPVHLPFTAHRASSSRLFCVVPLFCVCFRIYYHSY